MRVEYDGLTWEVSDVPCGSSTPDDMVELSYHAVSECPNCSRPINGIANFWSGGMYGSGSNLESIEYEDCDCFDEEEDDVYDFDDDEEDEDE